MNEADYRSFNRLAGYEALRRGVGIHDGATAVERYEEADEDLPDLPPHRILRFPMEHHLTEFLKRDWLCYSRCVVITAGLL